MQVNINMCRWNHEQPNEMGEKEWFDQVNMIKLVPLFLGEIFVGPLLLPQLNEAKKFSS